MAKGVHKGTELRNVNETWDENERRRAGSAPGSDDVAGGTTDNDDLQQVIKEEAAEYDNANKEDRLLGGERATVNDDQEDR